MEKVINGKKYNLKKELVEYIEELEYFHNYSLNKRVIEIHFGSIGHIIGMFKDYFSIPDEIIPDKDEFFEILKPYVLEGHKQIQWFVVKDENQEKIYIFPYVFWRIMPPKENNDDSDEDIEAEAVSD